MRKTTGRKGQGVSPCRLPSAGKRVEPEIRTKTDRETRETKEKGKSTEEKANTLQGTGEEMKCASGPKSEFTPALFGNINTGEVDPGDMPGQPKDQKRRWDRESKKANPGGGGKNGKRSLWGGGGNQGENVGDKRGQEAHLSKYRRIAVRLQGNGEGTESLVREKSVRYDKKKNGGGV